MGKGYQWKVIAALDCSSGITGTEKDVVRTTGKRNGGYRTSDYDKVPEKSRTSAIDTETGSAGYRGKKRSRKLSGCMVF